MSDTLAQTIKLVFGSEGGYSDHPKDPGGATKYGITAATLGSWRKLGRKATPAEIRVLTLEEATRILDRQYAQPVHYAELPAGLDYAVFDYAVNSGPAQAARTLQKAIGTAADGMIGARTLEAIAARPTADVINAVCDGRLKFLRGLSTWSIFGKGWSNRVAAVRSTALRSAQGQTMTMSPVEGRETASSIDTRITATTQGKGAIAASIGVAGTAIGSAKDAIQPLTGNHALVDMLFTILAAGGASLAVIGVCLVAYGQIAHIGAGEPI